LINKPLAQMFDWGKEGSLYAGKQQAQPGQVEGGARYVSKHHDKPHTIRNIEQESDLKLNRTKNKLMSK